MKIIVLTLSLLLASCGLFSTKPDLNVTGDNAQVQQATAGSTGAAENIEEITTINEDGIPTHWFIIGALVFGMIIPQPRFIRWLF